MHHHYSFSLCWLHQVWSQNLGLYFSMLWTYDNKWTLSVSLLSTTYLDLEICARVHTCGNIDHNYPPYTVCTSFKHGKNERSKFSFESTIFCVAFLLMWIKLCIGFQRVLGKWKTLKCGNRSTEKEVRKRIYGSEKKSRLSVAWLTDEPRQRVTVSKRCENQVLIHRPPTVVQP